MSYYAPVLIATLNRYEHFKRCVESLSTCKHAADTELYIALDYPLNESHWDGYKRIEKYLDNIKGFKNVIVFRRNKNYGARENFMDARSRIFEKYDRIIISEDDNIFSKDFLNFVNKGLDLFEDREDIFSINGYNYPIAIPRTYPEEVYLWCGFSAWGYGIWKDKFVKVDWSYSGLNTFLGNRAEVKKLNNIAEHYAPALQQIVKTGHITGDALICYHLFISNMYSVFPVISRVRNTGHEGSGVHCGYMESPIYRMQEIYSGNDSYNLPHDIKPDEGINKVLKKHFKISSKAKFKEKINSWLRI